MKYTIGEVLVWQSQGRILEGTIGAIIPANVPASTFIDITQWTFMPKYNLAPSDRYVLVDLIGHPKYWGIIRSCKWIDARAQKAT